jgi:hypothetical protein
MSTVPIDHTLELLGAEYAVIRFIMMPFKISDHLHLSNETDSYLA